MTGCRVALGLGLDLVLRVEGQEVAGAIWGLGTGWVGGCAMGAVNCCSMGQRAITAYGEMSVEVLFSVCT